MFFEDVFGPIASFVPQNILFVFVLGYILYVTFSLISGKGHEIKLNLEAFISSIILGSGWYLVSFFSILYSNPHFFDFKNMECIESSLICLDAIQQANNQLLTIMFGGAIIALVLSYLSSKQRLKPTNESFWSKLFNWISTKAISSKKLRKVIDIFYFVLGIIRYFIPLRFIAIIILGSTFLVSFLFVTAVFLPSVPSELQIAHITVIDNNITFWAENYGSDEHLLTSIDVTCRTNDKNSFAWTFNHSNCFNIPQRFESHSFSQVSCKLDRYVECNSFDINLNTTFAKFKNQYIDNTFGQIYNKHN